MADIVEKNSDVDIKVTKEIPARQETRIYNIDFLVNQKANIEADIARNQQELAIVENLILEAKGLGVNPIVALSIVEDINP